MKKRRTVLFVAIAVLMLTTLALVWKYQSLRDTARLTPEEYGVKNK